MQIPQKLVYGKFYVHKKNLRTRNCRRRFIKNLAPEKRKKKHVNQTTAKNVFKTKAVLKKLN